MTQPLRGAADDARASGPAWAGWIVVDRLGRTTTAWVGTIVVHPEREAAERAARLADSWAPARAPHRAALIQWSVRIEAL